MANLGRDEDAIQSYNAALAIKPTLHKTLENKGAAIIHLGRYEEAVFTRDKTLAIAPDFTTAFYNKSCAYDLWNKPDESLKSLQKAIELAPEEYIELAKTDTDLDSLRNDPRFQSLISSPELD